MDHSTHILVVEDQPLASVGILRLANRVGRAFLAPTVAAAKRALAVIENWGAFVIDVGLPDGSGMDVLAHAREVYPKTPAIVVTGLISPEVVNAAFDLRAGCLAKPLDGARLVRFFEEAASRAPRASDPVLEAVRTWASRWGLSLGEADVLFKAANGESREAIAESRGSSPSSVKDQERRVCDKTCDVSFQDAVSRLLRETARGGRS
jgi:DNA-binding NarL/FixJ family response regulator